MLNQFKKTYPKFQKKIFLCKYYPINTQVFKPRNKNKLRKKYNLPIDKKIILFSAQDLMDPRKGYHHFIDIVSKLKNQNDIFFVSIGKYKKKLSQIKNLGQIEFLPHNKISEIYSLSDIFICTSLIDNLPLTVLEALASGNLVISLKNGGTDEVLKNIGYSFKKNEEKRLIEKLKNVSSLEIREKSKKSRNFALKNFNEKTIGYQYEKIFNQIHS